MQIDDIRMAALNHERDTGRNPSFLLLTQREYSEIRLDAESMRVWIDAARYHPAEIMGLIVVLEGTRFHESLEAAGVELLRPNNQVQPRRYDATAQR